MRGAAPKSGGDGEEAKASNERFCESQRGYALSLQSDRDACAFTLGLRSGVRLLIPRIAIDEIRDATTGDLEGSVRAVGSAERCPGGVQVRGTFPAIEVPMPQPDSAEKNRRRAFRSRLRFLVYAVPLSPKRRSVSHAAHDQHASAFSASRAAV
jgi:hypothetical protein